MTPNWVATAQVLASATRGPRIASSAGRAMRAGIETCGRRFGYQLTAVDISNDFRAVSGFIPRTDVRTVTQVASAALRPAGMWLTSWGPKTTTEAIWDQPGITFGSAPLARIAFSGDYSAGSAVNLFPAEGRAPALGDSRQMDIALSVRPTPHLRSTRPVCRPH
jgi:hypothetical protein